MENVSLRLMEMETEHGGREEIDYAYLYHAERMVGPTPSRGTVTRLSICFLTP